jgi:hypothetical protein
MTQMINDVHAITDAVINEIKPIISQLLLYYAKLNQLKKISEKSENLDFQIKQIIDGIVFNENLILNSIKDNV